MQIPWHDPIRDQKELPVSQAPLPIRAGVVGRVGLLLLSCGTGAWRVRSSMNTLSRELGVTTTADIGLLSIEFTCFDGDQCYTQSLCLTNTGVNTSRLNRLEHFVSDFDREGKFMTGEELHSHLDEIERIHGLYSPIALGFAAALACSCFTFLLGGGIVEMLCAFCGAGIGNFVRCKLTKHHFTLFLGITASVCSASLVYAILLKLAEVLFAVSAQHEAGYICSMLFIIPGFPFITSGIDLAKLDMRSGLERLAYAVLIILVATMTAWIMALLLHLQPVQFPALSLTLPEAIVFRLLASFGGVFGFSLMFNSPRNLAVCAALIGAVTNTFRLELVSLAGFPPAIAAFLGALLSRFGKAQVAMPGGCNLGPRPIDQHLKVFSALGAEDSVDYGMITVRAKELNGAHIFFDKVSVGATMNGMLSAVMAKGQTILENCAKEPHVVDLANFLNMCGADVRGAGTDVIKVRGVEKMHGCTYSIIPDQIEAGSYMVAAAATGGDVLIKNVTPKHLEPITAKLRRAGITVEEFDDAVRVSRTGDILPLKINTMPHPGFPTDMQPLMGVLLSVAKGTSTITESVWDNRFRYVDELRKMGASVQVDGQVAVFEGVEKLSPAPLRASDLRAGAAMVVAALMADGTSEIEEIGHIERGYENIVEKLRGLGADISKVERMPAALEQAL